METLNPILLQTRLLKPFPFTSSSVKFKSHLYGSSLSTRRALSWTVNAQLKSTKETQTNLNDKGVSRKIILSGTAPPPVSEEAPEKPAASGRSSSGVLPRLKRLSRKVLSVLSNLRFAIGQMFVIAGLMALGTLIDQGEKPDFYFQRYPEENPVWGFFTWKWVLPFGFDHMYSSPIFLGSLALFGASLTACSFTTQIPLFKVARRWNFKHSADSVRKQEVSDTLPWASIQDLGVILMGAGFEVFLKGPTLYAFRGLAGRVAPVGVHLAMLLIMAGATVSATGSFRGSITVPQGLNFVVGDVLGPSGFLSFPTDTFNTEVHVNRFSMDFTENGQVSQFYSDLSLLDLDGEEVMRKTISVNDPLRFGGITIYQTDWSLSALQVTKNGEGPFNLAMAPLQVNGDKKLYGTFLPVGDANSPDVKGISMLARDLQSIVIYDQEGKFVGVRRPNSKLPIEIDGMEIIIEDAIGSTGLEVKTDPGVPVVYAGFGCLMLTTCISFLSHSQVWALQDGTAVVIGARTNRAKAEFQDEIDSLLDHVPEIVGPSAPLQPDIQSG